MLVCRLVESVKDTHTFFSFLCNVLRHEWIAFDDLIDVSLLEAVEDAERVGLDVRCPLCGEEDGYLSEVLAFSQFRNDGLLICSNNLDLSIDDEEHLLTKFAFVDNEVTWQVNVRLENRTEFLD